MPQIAVLSTGDWAEIVSASDVSVFDMTEEELRELEEGKVTAIELYTSLTGHRCRL